MHQPLPKTDATLLGTTVRALPYLLSWAVLAVLMIVGMDRMPLALYTPIDGEWAKWNVEAILHFGKVFDLSPYSMLAGMGSMYFPNLPWLNPGALALALPLDDHTKNIVSYAIYAAELAVSIVVLARVIGFSWLMATAAAQLYLYLLFPPFSEVFRIYGWYSLAPYYAHLQAVLNGAAAVLLVCGRLRDWRGNAILAAGFVALFISGLLSAPFTFVFATPAYIAICAALVADATTVASRMGMENLGACTMPAVLFRVRPPRLLSRHRGHGRPHTDHRHCVGPAPLCRGLAAAVPRSLDMQRSTAAAVHQRSRRVAADRGAVRGGAGHHHAPRRHPHRRLGFDRLYRPGARLCLRLSRGLARARGRALQPFPDLVLLVLHLHVCRRSVLRAVPLDQRERIRRRAAFPSQPGAGLPRQHPRDRAADRDRHHACCAIPTASIITGRLNS